MAGALRAAQSEQTDRVAKMYDHEWWGTEVAKANRYEADQAVNAAVKSRQDIADTVAAVRWIGRRIPARVACLEESSASVLALALRGRAATWCHGVAPDPIRLHA